MNKKPRMESAMQISKPAEQGDTLSDPLFAALAAAEWDDEPYTDEQQALSETGQEEILRGESVTLEEVKMRFASQLRSRLRASG